MDYNQYWNEIRGDKEEPQKREDIVKEENTISFSYGEAPEEPVLPKSEENFFDEDEEDIKNDDVETFDDSKMYSNSSLFEMIDELEESEETEESEKLDESRFVSFDFSGEDSEEDKDVHIFADELDEVLDEDDEEDGVVLEPAADSTIINLDAEEPEPEDEESVEVPHFECPVFEEKPETDIDKLIQEAKRKDEEEKSAQENLLESDLLPLLKDIISFIPSNSPFIDYIAELSNDDRKDFVRAIEQARNAWAETGNDKMFTVPDGQFSVCVLADVSDPMRDVQRLETVGAQMFSYEKESWCFVKLYFDDSRKLLRAAVENVSKDSFNSWQWRVVQQNGYNLWKARQ